MDTSRLAFPKGRPAALLRQDVKRQRISVDERESDKVKKRSDGQCEVVIRYVGTTLCAFTRCLRRALHIHHMIGGWGKRGRGESAKAIRKQHVCQQCHEDIGSKVLQRIGGELPHYTDTYRRLR